MENSNNSVAPCECRSFGFCSRHSVVKNQGWFELCKSNDSYRRAWDEGRGPGQFENGRGPSSIEEVGSNLWKELHLYAVENESSWDRNDASRFYSDWSNRIPNSGCACKEKWGKLVRKNRPRFSSPYVFFKWSVEAHNTVNEKLGKPAMDLAEAMSLYGFVA